MNITKRFLSILLVATISVSAWALDKDADGYYLIGSVQDWKDFATLVQTTPASYNAKLTTDVDLGSEQTMLGSIEQPYSGTFDGQGFTLTVHLNNTVDGVAPFRRIDNTTIKNLAVAGSVTGDIHSSGLVGGVPENSEYNLISNVMVSTTITTTGSHCGGILGHGGSTTNTTIQDCLFNGTINGKSGGSTVGVIWGWQTYGHANITNCLENGTYTNTSSFNPVFLTASGPANVANTYYVTGSSTYGTQATSETLADGTVTNALNNERTGDDAPWVQQGGKPMLKMFALQQDADGYYLLGSVQDWDAFAELVKTTPTANAKMTADIDLGDDQTVIGGAYNGSPLYYKGTFDGQGHTLTIAYNNTSGENFTCPFSLIEGATIKNLHLDGTVNSVYAYGGSIASILRGANTIENVWNSVESVCTMGGWVQMGSFIGVLGSGATTINDCLFTGSITHNGGYSGYFNGGYGPAPTVKNCLVLGNFTGEFGFNGNYSNCYCKHASTTGVTLTADGNLSDGATTAALNGERIGDDAPWIQDPVTNQPMLKMFVSLKQDADGYYLLGSVQDWDNFAALVETTPSANAKMTADIDLGDDQTKIGDDTRYTNPSTPNANNPYRGVFDGQGHTLTVNYTTEEGKFPSPFPNIEGATIKNLHVAGSIVSTTAHAGGVVSASWGTDHIENVWVSATISSTGQSWDECGAIVACMKKGTLTLNDCLFTGNMTSTQSYNGCFVGYCNAGTTTVTNCLSTGTFTYYGSSMSYGSITHTNCYVKQFPASIPPEMQCSDEKLADGTIASKLGSAWVQDGSTPMLKIFVSNNSGIATGEALPLNDNGQMINDKLTWYSLDGKKLNGRPTEKGIYIHNGNKMIVK